MPTTDKTIKPSAYVTIEVETEDGEPVDMEQVRKLLHAVDLRLSGWSDGHNILALGSLRRAYEQFGDALEIAGVIKRKEEVE